MHLLPGNRSRRWYHGSLCGIAAVAALLAAHAVGLAQTVTLPPEVRVEVGRLAAVPITYDGTDLRWDVPPALDVFREYDPNPAVVRLRLIGYQAGTYRLLAVSAKDGKLSPFAVCAVQVGPLPPTPPVPPGPGPTPPGPGPTPVPGGLRVLIVYESGELSKLPAPQQNVLYAAPIRDYLNAKAPLGPDGKTREWRIYDKDVDLSAEAKVWQDLIKRPRTKTPWIVITTDKESFEGELPADVEQTLALLRKYGG